MITLYFMLGLLLGSVLTFSFIAIVFRSSKNKTIQDYNERSLEALQERNRISRAQLEIMQREELK